LGWSAEGTKRQAAAPRQEKENDEHRATVSHTTRVPPLSTVKMNQKNHKHTDNRCTQTHPLKYSQRCTHTQPPPEAMDRLMRDHKPLQMQGDQETQSKISESKGALHVIVGALLFSDYPLSGDPRVIDCLPSGLLCVWLGCERAIRQPTRERKIALKERVRCKFACKEGRFFVIAVWLLRRVGSRA
jgi:hypothetical protein